MVREVKGEKGENEKKRRWKSRMSKNFPKGNSVIRGKRNEKEMRGRNKTEDMWERVESIWRRGEEK